MLNYIHQLNKFEELCTGILPPKAQIIYYKLFKWSNRFGLGEPFLLSNSVLMLETGISNTHTFTLNRNILKQQGFIDFKPGNPGKKTEYILVDLTQHGNKPLVTNCYQPTVSNKTAPQTALQTALQNDFLLITNNKTKVNINKKREDLCNSGSSSLKEAVELFQNSIRPLKNVYEAEQIEAIVAEYGIERFKEALKVVIRKRPKVPLPYLESVLRNNKDCLQHNDPVSGAAEAQRILESGELIDFNSE